MTNLTELELQNLKHLIELQDTNYQKLSNYSDYAVDPQIKQFFTKAAQDSLSNKQTLLSFLE
jgi:ferritin